MTYVARVFFVKQGSGVLHSSISVPCTEVDFISDVTMFISLYVFEPITVFKPQIRLYLNVKLMCNANF